VRRIDPSAFRVARRDTSREINRQIALNLVREREPVSRAELARLMGMRRGAVSLYVGGEITAAWDLLESTVRDSLRESALLAETGETEIRVVPLGEQPRLRGAAALVSAPAFAPIVA